MLGMFFKPTVFGQYRLLLIKLRQLCVGLLLTALSQFVIADDSNSAMQLTQAEAANLLQLPLACAEVEYPNKLGQTLRGDEDLASPKALHPAFYGCFDWHSAVHGHWSMVRLLRAFPPLRAQIRQNRSWFATLQLQISR